MAQNFSMRSISLNIGNHLKALSMILASRDSFFFFHVKFLPVHFSEIVDLRIMLFLHLLYLALQFFNIGVPF